METKTNDVALLLKEMHLPVMSEVYLDIISNPKYQTLSFEQKLLMMAQKEYDSRNDHTIEKIIKKAEFSVSNANIKDINYRPDRKIDQGMIESFKTNNYIKDGLNIIIIGPSGTGKTWISCALGVNACEERYHVYYTRLSDLSIEMERQKALGTYQKFIKKLNKIDLLIIDDFLLTPINDNDKCNLLEIMEARCNKKSTILCAQWAVEGWYDKLSESPITDAIMDRVVNSSYKLQLFGRSLREEYSKLNQ